MLLQPPDLSDVLKMRVSEVRPQILQQVRHGTLDIVLEVSKRTDVQDQLSSTNVVAWQVDDLEASFHGRLASQSFGEDTRASGTDLTATNASINIGSDFVSSFLPGHSPSLKR